MDYLVNTQWQKVNTLARDKSLRIRMSDEEHDDLKRAADTEGFVHVSEYVRAIVQRTLGQSQPPQPPIEQSPPDRRDT